MAQPKARPRKKDETTLEYISYRAIRWAGSVHSLIIHTLLFTLAFCSYFFGASFSNILLVVTTIVSLEAIYLSLFAQMTLNQHSDDLEGIQEDVEEIGEDVEGIEKDVEEIQKDVEDISEDVGEIQEDVEEISEDVEEIQKDVEDIGEDVEEINEDEDDGKRYDRIEKTLATLMSEIAELKKPAPIRKKK
jgi:septal ring factor EnvC (AmiA/AmiB activator)